MSDWAFLGRRVLMVSRFPPAPDGIARYAEQLASALEREPGRAVERCAEEVWGGLRPLRLLPRARRADEVLVHWHPDYYFRFGWASRVAAYAALAVVFRARRTTVLVHELDAPRPAEIGRRGKAQFAIEEAARRLMWRGAARVAFHSEWERGAFRFRARETRIVEHGEAFTPVADVPVETARERLGLPADHTILACLGFISPHKGWDRAVAAFAAAGREDAELHLVGTPIRPLPEITDHVEALRAAAAATPGVHFAERYLSDEDFDLWVRAADALLLPYRSAASSGLMARARLLGTPVITTGAGGLAEQAGPEDVVVGDDAGLAAQVAAAGRARR